MADELNADGTPKGEKSQLKFFAAVLVMVAAIGNMIYRLPDSKYQETHADKPRPPRGAPQRPAAPAPAAVAARPAAAAASSAPAAVAKAPTSSSSTTMAAGPGSGGAGSDEPAVAWQDACAGEIGLLCYKVAEERLPRCLRPYEDALRSGCRTALTRGGLLPEEADD
ncbi:MAG TPA: hypothetical protein VNI01_10435 [Elusimicrobiota bacterium]|jgi:hypothetical protein|nr:hypothetical protein [Elusimicrobiota bacterium]